MDDFQRSPGYFQEEQASNKLMNIQLISVKTSNISHLQNGLIPNIKSKFFKWF